MWSNFAVLGQRHNIPILVHVLDVLLRNILLVSSMLFNSEAWYNVSKSELDLVDAVLLRGILKAPKSTPKEMLFLELGVVPFREIIRQRRLGFLFYILHENQGYMIHRFFESQREINLLKIG